MKAVVALLAALCLVSATTFKGVDVSYYSGVVSQSAFTCMKAANYEFVVIEAWVERHSCSTFTQTYQNAIAAGIPQVDAYAFICNSCMGGSGNVESIVSGLKSVLPSGFNGRIWLDIEYASGIWSSNGASNMAFAQSVANALTKAGYTLGIYTNYNNWQQIMMGQKTNPFSNLPLWYPRYDNNPNPTVGITNFGGWNGCTIKQYNENIKVCGINTDVNVATTLYPNNKNGTPTPTPTPNNNNNNNNHESNNESKNNESNQESSAKQSSSQKASSSPASQQNSESSAKSSAQATHPSTPSSQASNQASSQASSQHSTVQASQNSAPSTKSTKSSSN